MPDHFHVHLRLRPVILFKALLIHTHVVLLIRVKLSGIPEGWRGLQPEAMAGWDRREELRGASLRPRRSQDRRMAERSKVDGRNALRIPEFPRYCSPIPRRVLSLHRGQHRFLCRQQ